MILFSRDKFFHLGIQSLVNKNHSSYIDVILLDSSRFLYIINSQWFYKQNFKTPLSALLYCSMFMHNRDITLNTFLKIINYNSKIKYPVVVKKLTAAELKVINAIYNGDESRDIASRYERSDKTINLHKNRALHKLGVRNISMLHNLLSFWEVVLTDLNNHNV
ncbi:helix-turn-helix transcriptional regulator [Citrobacter portucalensis]|uniref:helix-turn-helix transcriptional regulator n=1 Tax=Citrobacter portucalensis TaxID=1639133 RepID=UPI0039FBCE79